MKINANIGNSAVSSSIGDEVEKMTWATRWGADTVMDLSTGRNIHETREWIVRNSPVPIGTVPIYQALEKVDGKAEELTREIYRDISSSRPSRAFPLPRSTGVLCAFILMTASRHDRHRLARRFDHGEVALAHHRESFLYTRFEEICEIMKVRRRIRSATPCAPAPATTRTTRCRWSSRRWHEPRRSWKTTQTMIEGPTPRRCT